MRRVEWMGVRLPRTIPALQQAWPHLTRQEREAIDAVEAACSGMLRIPGATAFLITPAQGFSKSYRFSLVNQFVEHMEDSDARLLFRGEGIIEHEQFRDIDRDDHRHREPPYPNIDVMINARIYDPKSRRQYMVTPRQAKIVRQLIRRFARARNGDLIAQVREKDVELAARKANKTSGEAFIDVTNDTRFRFKRIRE